MDETGLLAAVLEIRDLLRLMAEPAIAERDKKLRDELKRIAGASAKTIAAVQIMDGSGNQQSITDATKIDKGQLSRLVKQLAEANLLVGDTKRPRLAITVPPNFFERGA